MKKTRSLLTVSLVLLISSCLTTVSLYSSSLMVGTIQFPHSLSNVPMIRVYTCGKKIPYQLCETDNDSKQFTFCIPQITYEDSFFLLITNKVYFEPVHNKELGNLHSTIKYLKVLPTQAYKLYKLVLKSEKTTGGKMIYHWDILEIKIDPKNGRIPDDAIIICYEPTFVDCLTGGSAFELPTIQLKSDILNFIGSETKLHDLSNQMLMASIDSDPIHAVIHQEIKRSSHINIVAPAT